jgi:hypothetical protein
MGRVSHILLYRLCWRCLATAIGMAIGAVRSFLLMMTGDLYICQLAVASR